jgi:hypothetical protein
MKYFTVLGGMGPVTPAANVPAKGEVPVETVQLGKLLQLTRLG